MATINYYVQGGLRRGWLKPACGSLHAGNGHERYSVGRNEAAQKNDRTAKGCTRAFSFVIE